MKTQHPKARRFAAAAVVSVAIAAALVLSGCTASGSAGSGASADGDGQLLVWADATRQPAVDAYAKAHPAVKIDVVTVDGGDLASKLSLLARDAKSLPDVVFTANGESVKFAQDFDFSADLTNLVDKKVRDGFGAALTACTVDGKVYCLPQDISTQMLWYNKPLFDQFGYTVPKTWEEYAALSTKVATEHPGYVTGSCGDGFCPNVYYRGSDCPGVTEQGKDAQINLASNPDCTRVTDMLDPLIANGSVKTLSPFDPDMTTLGTDNKVLMLPGFVWYGSVLFEGSFKNAAGSIAAAPLPSWGDKKQGAGAAVGGQWIVNAKSSDPVAASALITALTTDDESLAAAVTFPAYEPAAAAWIAKSAQSGYYAVDPTDTFTSARADVTGNLYTPTGFEILTSFQNAVSPKLKEGAALSSLIETWEQAQAQSLTDAGWKAVIK
ncbi:extracellular solute-binding protein [Plantibacter flavus]|uniref:ABC transporter substrate-binding protein n=1 Tax=Plantibacter flavus TaxID=150123 RepID=UPI003F14B868